MKRIYSLSFCLFFFCALRAQETSVFSGVNVLRPERGEILMDQDVMVRDGKIVSVASRNNLPYDRGVRVLDFKGKYILPGLSEMHAHIPVPENEDDQQVQDVMMLYLANGVTVIRGMLGNPYHLRLKSILKRGDFPGPRVYSSSPSLNGNSVPTPGEAESKVRQYKSDGYDFLKIHPGIRLEVMEALVRTAGEVGIRFAGHVPVDVGIRRALDFGYWSVDHLDGYVDGLVPGMLTAGRDGGFFGYAFREEADISLLDELAAMTRENGVWMVPTQSLFTRWFSPEEPAAMMQAEEMAFMPSRTRFAWLSGKQQLIADSSYSPEAYEKFLNLRQQILKGLHEKGVRLLLGSDSPQVMNVPGFSIHHEIDAMLQAGIPVKDILIAGTSNPAEFFGRAGEFGSILAGAEAEFIIVDDNPLDNVKTLRRPVGTFVRGRWYTREYFDKHLQMIAERNAD